MNAFQQAASDPHNWLLLALCRMSADVAELQANQTYRSPHRSPAHNLSLDTRHLRIRSRILPAEHHTPGGAVVVGFFPGLLDLVRI
jgi:hypothetical protein